MMQQSIFDLFRALRCEVCVRVSRREVGSAASMRCRQDGHVLAAQSRTSFGRRRRQGAMHDPPIRPSFLRGRASDGDSNRGRLLRGNRTSNSFRPRSSPTQRPPLRQRRPEPRPMEIHPFSDVQIRRISIDIGEGSRLYSTPGQFVQVRVQDSKPAFMAVSSLPGSDSTAIDLLVKCSGETAERLCRLSQGSVGTCASFEGAGSVCGR